MKKCIILILIVGLVMFHSLPVLAAVKVGQEAPGFTLADTNGTEHRLSNFQGKYVVLEWLNHDCPFVRKHYDSQNMQGLQKKYTDSGIVWLSINSSAPGKQGNYHPEEANKLTSEKGAMPTAVLLDSDGKVGKQYDAKTTPHMYIIDPKGILIYQGAIDDRASANPDDIPNSINYIQKALDESLSGSEVSVPATKSYGCSVKY